LTAVKNRVVILRSGSYGPYAPKKRTLRKLAGAPRLAAYDSTYRSLAFLKRCR